METSRKIIGSLVILSGFLCLRRARYLAWRCPYSWQLRYYAYGVAVSMLVALTTSLFMTQLYIEEFWWLLTLPICTLRAAEFEYARARLEADGAPEASPAGFGWCGQPDSAGPQLGLA